MTTYVVGVNTDHPDDFKDYLSNQRGYNLVTRAKEEELWKRQAAETSIQGHLNSVLFLIYSANFEWIQIEDKKDYFVSTMERELRELRGMKNAFIKVCPENAKLKKKSYKCDREILQPATLYRYCTFRNWAKRTTTTWSPAGNRS